MNKFAPIATVALAALLAACGNDSAPTSTNSGTEPKTMIGKAADKAIAKARAKLATENISLRTEEGLSKGEITPQGDLLIDGKAITIDDKQRALLLEYRKRTHEIAEVGMQIGTQGADLAGKAISGAIGNIFGGDTEEFEKRMEAEGKAIEAAATKLCDKLPGLLEAQNALAASLPQFEPYAKMTQKDVDECRSDNGKAIEKAIEGAFDEKVNVEVDIDASNHDGKNAAEEAEAAGAEMTKTETVTENR
jgi:hypothetical protein